MLLLLPAAVCGNIQHSLSTINPRPSSNCVDSLQYNSTCCKKARLLPLHMLFFLYYYSKCYGHDSGLFTMDDMVYISLQTPGTLEFFCAELDLTPFRLSWLSPRNRITAATAMWWPAGPSNLVSA